MGWALIAVFLAGAVTPFLLYACWLAIGYALLRDSGTQCMICDHLHINIEERRTRIYIWIRKGWHRVWWRSRRWHKDATKAYFAKWSR